MPTKGRGNKIVVGQAIPYCLRFYTIKKLIMFLKKHFVLALLMFISIAAQAQKTYTLKVVDEQKKPLVGATISVDGILFAQTDENGSYNLSVKQSKVNLNISMVGFITLIENADLNVKSTFTLKKKIFISEEAIVTATRVNEKTAGTYSMVDKQYIEKTNFGQDLPYLLNQIPSVVITSDAGNGIGYTGIRIRGTDQQRTNLTINGIPLNDAESQGTFTVNISDFASSVENIQVQRGVGSSTNGAGAFGASINIQTTQMADTASAEVNFAQGGYKAKNLLLHNDMEKYTATVNTGLIHDHWNFSGRLSKIASRGYVDNSSAVLKSFFTSASYRNNKHLLKFNVFSNLEKTYLAWNGVPEDSLKTNRTYNPISAEYSDQYDNYQQDHYQIFESYKVNSRHHLNIGYHYTRGRGYFQEFRYDQKYANYGLDTLFVGNDTISKTDLLRRRWLQNEFEGIVYSWEYSPNTKFKLTVGGASNRYKGLHFGEIIWAKDASNSRSGTRWYEGWGYKNESNLYSKANYEINNKWNVNIDLQYRYVNYEIQGMNKDRIDVGQIHKFNFFNPKAGISYNISNTHMIYLTYGATSKEPNRDDFVNGIVNNVTPKAEKLSDVELGWKRRSNKYAVEVNAYYMNYKNQLVLTGEVNNVGEYIRINTPKSYRAGIEFSGDYNYTTRLKISATLALSQNKINAFAESIYQYDADYNYIGVLLREHKNTDISFSPNVIGSSRLRYKIYQNLFATLESKYVGKQFMDNTSNEGRKINAFFVNDLFVDYTITLKGFIPSMSILFKVNNVFDKLYEPNGYTYSLIESGVENNYNYYYPQAGRNYMFSLNCKF